MPISFVKGDVFAHDGLTAYAHGCNCAGAMGRGIAVEFRRRYPTMYKEYKARCQRGEFVLGDVFVWTEGGTTVYNLGTQRTWRVKAELGAIEKAVREMVRLAETTGVARIGLPRIGAGHGALAWPDVQSLLARIGS